MKLLFWSAWVWGRSPHEPEGPDILEVTKIQFFKRRIHNFSSSTTYYYYSGMQGSWGAAPRNQIRRYILIRKFTKTINFFKEESIIWVATLHRYIYYSDQRQGLGAQTQGTRRSKLIRNNRNNQFFKKKASSRSELDIVFQIGSAIPCWLLSNCCIYFIFLSINLYFWWKFCKLDGQLFNSFLFSLFCSSRNEFLPRLPCRLTCFWMWEHYAMKVMRHLSCRT